MFNGTGELFDYEPKHRNNIPWKTNSLGDDYNKANMNWFRLRQNAKILDQFLHV